MSAPLFKRWMVLVKTGDTWWLIEVPKLCGERRASAIHYAAGALGISISTIRRRIKASTVRPIFTELHEVYRTNL